MMVQWPCLHEINYVKFSHEARNVLLSAVKLKPAFTYHSSWSQFMDGEYSMNLRNLEEKPWLKRSTGRACATERINNIVLVLLLVEWQSGERFFLAYGDSSEIKVTDEFFWNFPWIFSTKHSFENYNKNDRSPFSFKRCDGPILPHLCLYSC